MSSVLLKTLLFGDVLDSCVEYGHLYQLKSLEVFVSHIITNPGNR